MAFGRSASSTSLRWSPSAHPPARTGSVGATHGRSAASQSPGSRQLTHDQLQGDGPRSSTSFVTLIPRPASASGGLRREVSFGTQRPRSAASGIGHQTAPTSPSPHLQGSQQGSWPSRARSEASERSSPEEEALYHRLHEELAAEQQRRHDVPPHMPAAGGERPASHREGLAFGSWQGEENM